MIEKVIYIAGYGRSGSTLIDMSISQHADVFGAGEISAMCRHVWRNDEYCACGERIHECPIWSKIMSRWMETCKLDAFFKLQRSVEPLFAPKRFFGNKARNTYSEQSRKMFAIIRDVTGASVVLDSSKAPGRGMALASNPEIDLRVIHLVRDPRAVCHAMARPIPMNIEAGVQKKITGRAPERTAVRWLLYNAMAERLRREVGPKKSVLVRYENFVISPARELARIAEAIDIDLSDIASKIGAGVPIASGHQMAGSRIRMRPPMQLRFENSWSKEMSEAYKRRVYWITRRQCERYGYPSRVAEPG